MEYSEYLSAATRHKKTCAILKERIEENSDDGIVDINDEELGFLIINLYYLSGYIIECSLKYKILEIFGYYDDVNDKVKLKDVLSGHGLSKNDFITHNLDKLIDTLDSEIPDLINRNYKLDKLLARWGPFIRYESIIINYSDVCFFYDHATCFMKKI